MKKTENKLESLRLNKSLIVDNASKQITPAAENGRYTYFDYDKEVIKKIVEKDAHDLRVDEAFCLVQALFPKHLICAGLFDSFLIFEIKDGKRSDPPVYCYNSFSNYLNNNFVSCTVIMKYKKRTKFCNTFGFCLLGCLVVSFELILI